MSEGLGRFEEYMGSMEGYKDTYEAKIDELKSKVARNREVIGSAAQRGNTEKVDGYRRQYTESIGLLYEQLGNYVQFLNENNQQSDLEALLPELIASGKDAFEAQISQIQSDLDNSTGPGRRHNKLLEQLLQEKTLYADFLEQYKQEEDLKKFRESNPEFAEPAIKEVGAET